MGSGISLSKEQVISLIQRDLTKKFYDNQQNLPMNTEDGCQIYYDFTDEAKYRNILKILHQFQLQENNKERNGSNKY
jgi:hypothetical protein